MKGLPARELQNSDPFGLGIIRTTQNCKYSAHDDDEEGLTQEKEKTDREKIQGELSKLEERQRMDQIRWKQEKSTRKQQWSKERAAMATYLQAKCTKIEPLALGR